MSSSNQVVDSTGRKTDNYTTSTYFMPNPEARGEVARATMYLHVRYGYSVTGNFQSVALMLKWHIEHPVTNREIYRNNIVHSLQNMHVGFGDPPIVKLNPYVHPNPLLTLLALKSPLITPQLI
jgi:endonuclease I